LADKTTLTTGEIARHCGVNFRTVIRWIKRGELKAFQLPGRGDNRVPVRDFIQFLKQNQMPIPEEFSHLERRVLIVDDDANLARSIARTLARAGFETETAADGFQAGARVEAFAPTVMTLDLSMPGLGGLDVIRFVRGEESLAQLKILVVSAMPLDKLKAAVAAGADDYLEKPFDNAELIARVENLSDI
jgi:two-component system, OmpR family, response regulator VicR